MGNSRLLPRVLALTGPTAAGKSAAAMAIAQQHPIEIVSVDSALVYRGMDIGTAKPTAADLALGEIIDGGTEMKFSRASSRSLDLGSASSNSRSDTTPTSRRSSRTK